MQKSEKYFKTGEFISEIEHLDLLKKEHLFELERLCKKIDVVKEVFKIYKEDLSKAVTDISLSEDEYKKFAYILSKFAYIYKDFKFYNSYLKLCDILHVRGIKVQDSTFLKRFEMQYL